MGVWTSAWASARIAVRALRVNKLRSALTMLGIVIGVGAVITIMLAEVLRIGFGTRAVGWDNLVYGVLLVVFIIFLPKGILGSILERLKTLRKSWATP